MMITVVGAAWVLSLCAPRRQTLARLLRMFVLGGVQLLTSLHVRCGLKVAVLELALPPTGNVFSCTGQPDP